MPRNQNWYDLNESRLWPFDDQALLTDDTGLRMPNDLLADIYLRYPSSLGERLFLSTFTAGPGIVTLTILASGPSLTPVASVSLPRPVDIRRMYEVEPLADGVGGWVVFGSGIDDQEMRSFRFSDPLQSTFLSQTARSYLSLPVPTVGKLYGGETLTGIVRLQGGTDIETAVEEREIAGVMRDTIVVRLKEKLDVEEARNLLELYAGDCGRRPESGNCLGPDPVEGINTVTPDCCGNIYVELRGCGDIKSIDGECGILIDCGFGLSESCVTPDRLPDAFGKLPNEYDDLCENYSESLSVTDPEDPSETYSPVSRAAQASYPYFENFDDMGANQFNIVAGNYMLTRGGNGSGLVDTVITNSGDAQFNFVGNVPYALPDSFSVKLNSVAAYNTNHTRKSVVSSQAVVSNTAYTSDGAGGLWREIATNPNNGNVFEAQEDRINVALWNEGLPEGASWDCLHKRAEVVLSIQVGNPFGKNNGGLLFNYIDSQNYWVVEIEMDYDKSFRVIELDDGVWKVRSTVQVPALNQENRYELAVEVYPMDAAGGSTSGLVHASLRGLDDAVVEDLRDVALPNFMPGTGFFGFHSDRSLTWFEYIYVDNSNP
jgi:hypothetical protein